MRLANRHARYWVRAVLLAGVGVWLCEQASGLALPPNESGRAEIDRLVAQLGNDNFNVREGASKRLEAIGEAALDALQKAAWETNDPEVRRRAEHLVTLLNAKRYQLLRSFCGHSRPVRSIAFSPDGKRALSGSDDGTMLLWDVDTGKQLRRFSAHTGFVIQSRRQTCRRRYLGAGRTFVGPEHG